MAMITRLSRLFRADVHAVLDRVEEPELLLRQAVREMEDELAAEGQRQRAATLQREQLDARMADIDASIDGIAEELDLCFQAGNDGLARSLLRRRLEGERLRKALGKASRTLETQCAARERSLEERGRRLDGMRQKLALFETEGRNAGDDSSGWSADDIRISDADVEVAFLREQQRRAS